jgi:precorrin-6A/cobalt-precorrin-6A reductase
MTTPSLLILGGTGEAAALAGAAIERFGDGLDVISSLAGRTRRPGRLPGRVRVGGFGGPEGLAAYLRRHEIDRLIDATHPFAAAISHAARLACEAVGVPRLMLLRRPWERHPDDQWIETDTLAEAAAVVGRLARRPWLTIGAGDLAAFSAITSAHFLVRLVDPPLAALPLPSYEVIEGRGPFTLAAERRCFEHHSVDLLVTKASGGVATAAKLAAARELGVRIVMLKRPPPEPGPAVETIAAALDWLAAPISVAAAGRQP